MHEVILSVGIDIGTSTTQLIFSRLTIENRASSYTVPRIDIVDKEVIYRSKIYFTPLRSATEIDAEAVKRIVREEYQAAGMTPEMLRTGAVIITGETARKENANEVLEALSDLAGDFVVATAGPDLESVLSARGAGTDALSKEKRTAIANVDIGGGTTDIAVITLGSMACSTSLKLAGDALTAAVQRFVQEKYQIVVGENMAERIKIALGSVAPLPVPLSFEVSGKDLATASPRTIALSDTDTREAFQPITEKLVSAVMGILEVTPPELGADIMRQGMLLTGGGALLRGFADRITRATRIPVYVDSDPLTTVLRGAGITLDDPEKYRDLLIEC